MNDFFGKEEDDVVAHFFTRSYYDKQEQKQEQERQKQLELERLFKTAPPPAPTQFHYDYDDDMTVMTNDQLSVLYHQQKQQQQQQSPDQPDRVMARIDAEMQKRGLILPPHLVPPSVSPDSTTTNPAANKTTTTTMQPQGRDLILPPHLNGHKMKQQNHNQETTTTTTTTATTRTIHPKELVPQLSSQELVWKELSTRFAPTDDPKNPQPKTVHPQTVARAEWWKDHISEPVEAATAPAQEWLQEHVSSPVQEAAAPAHEWLQEHVASSVEEAAASLRPTHPAATGSWKDMSRHMGASLSRLTSWMTWSTLGTKPFRHQHDQNPNHHKAPHHPETMEEEDGSEVTSLCSRTILSSDEEHKEKKHKNKKDKTNKNKKEDKDTENDSQDETKNNENDSQDETPGLLDLLHNDNDSVMSAFLGPQLMKSLDKLGEQATLRL